MKHIKLRHATLAAGLALGGLAVGAAPVGATATSGSCQVQALTPSTRYVAGVPSATAGRAIYHCNYPGRLTIKLVKNNPWPLGDTSLPGWYYNVAARASWSGVYAGPEANCAAYGRGSQYRTEATLTFNGRSITDKGEWYRSC